MGLPETTKALLLTALLFAGPLFEKGIVEGRWRDWIEGQPLYESLSSWMGWRNFVAGPITEELLFRSLLVSLHLLTTLSATRVILLTPLYFGIAHIHHFYEFKLTHLHTPLLPALLRSLIQFAYTTVFGWYATFVFLRTGNVVAVILVHTFCNWCGLPRLWGRVEPRVAIGGPSATRGKEDNRTEQGKGRKTTWFWSIAYYLLLVAGAVGFQHCLWSLTESPRALAKVG